MAFIESYPQPVPSAVISDAPRAMPRVSDCLRGIVAGAALAFVGLGVHSAVSTGTPAPAPSPAAAVPMTLAQRVLPPSTFPGFIETQRPSVIRQAGAWAKLEPAAAMASNTARLRSIGFVAGISEQLTASGGSRGDGLDRRALRHRHGRRRPAALRVRPARGPAWRGPVRRPRLPGAVGISIHSRGVVAGDVLFTVGPYYYLVAAGAGGTGRGVPGPTSLTRTAGVQF